jgi:NAD(P)-dependent dehydrogenase (short-subunit alcohol dehydrogenase family)
MIASPFSLEDKVAVVTGAGSGIGKAAAEALAAAGATVIVADRNLVAARDVAGGLNSAIAVEADVTQEQAIEAMFAAAPGRVDILVNNAGLAIRRPSVELSAEDWNKVVDVNMTAVFLCARAAARRMIADGEGGAIVNVTRALAVEWAAQGIRVNAVAPTWVRTPFIQPILAEPELVARIEAMTPMRRLAEPEEVASAILFLASPAAAMVTGHTLPVDGGFLAQ